MDLTNRENALRIQANAAGSNKPLGFELVAVQPVHLGTIDVPLYQDECAIAIGSGAGYYRQGECAIAIGHEAGHTQQGDYAIGIGSRAGELFQKSNAIALGYEAANVQQGAYGIALGYQAAEAYQLDHAVALGVQAGQLNQGTGSVALGLQAGQYNQRMHAVALGTGAGRTGQGTYAVAIGYHAGQTNQPNNSIVLNASGAALGTVTQAGAFYAAPIRTGAAARVLYYDTSSKEVVHGPKPDSVPGGTTYSNYLFWNATNSTWDIGSNTVHLGGEAGRASQGAGAVAIGQYAGQTNQGVAAVAIGQYAGQTNQPDRSIVVNASGTALTTVTQSDACYVAPVRGATGSNVLYYDPNSKEVTYGAGGGGGGGIDAGQRVPVLGRYDYGGSSDPTYDPLTSTAPPPPVFSGTVRYVGGVGGDFATVALALAAANAGDIIEVRAGYTSNENGIVIVSKSVEIRGQNRSTSVITGPTTTIAAGSNGASLPQAIINVSSTAGFPSSGTLNVFTTSWQAVTYTGVTATSFTGCSGGTGVMSTGNSVLLSNLGGLLSVSAGVNDVYIHTATLRNNQIPSLDNIGGLSSCITAATMTASYPLGSSGLYFSDLTLVHPKMGISINAAGFVIDNCMFTCNTTTPGVTVRSIINYGQTGVCFIQNSALNATLDVTPRSIHIYLTTNSPGSGTFIPGHTGNLVIQNMTQYNTCSAYFIQDVFHQPDTRNNALNGYQSAPALGGFGLFFSNCTFNGQYSGNSISFVENTSTTIAAGSNGAILPQVTLNVASAAAFPASGTLNVFSSSGWQTITFTGRTATTFTGCTGGTGTLTTGNNVNGLNPLSFFSKIYVNNCVGQARITGDDKGFIAVASSSGSGRQTGAPTTGLIVTGTNTFNSILPSATYVNASTVANLLGVFTGNYATPALIPAIVTPVPSGAVTTADGVSLALGSRAWLLSWSPVYSGIYTVNAGVWTRTSDFVNGTAVNGTYFWVKSGTTYGNTQWECTNAVGSDIVGTNILTWQAASIFYIPATSSSWAGTPPTTISAALDRLAALLKTLNAGVGA
jgi:hypothetical protein